MTQALNSAKSSQVTDTVTIFYQVGMSQPASHLFEVTLQVTNWQQDVLKLVMPVWTPGSYLVREYARHVQDFIAHDSQTQQSLKSNKVSKNHWEIVTGDSQSITVKYRVFANDLTVRTNHLDRTHGYFNGAALFMFIPDFQQQPIAVEILPPHEDWQISTTLNPVNNKPNTFSAPDFDTLVDTPVEVGIHQVYDFEVLGKPHQYVVWGEGNLKAQKLIKDTQKIIEVEAKIFDGLPYDKYLFLLHLSGSGFGGLEHKDCCTLNYPRLGFRDRDKYNRFMQLVAHEFFHLWNVKRIRPKALEIFDYERESYTTSLWFCEGTTSYYDVLIPLRAGIYNRKQFFKNLSKDLNRYLITPGRNVQPLSESSFDAWIKLYRRESHSDNNQISYYLKGQWVALLLDLIIREKHHNQKSLDDVMGILWHRYGKKEIGFTDEELQQVVTEVADTDLTDFFQRYLDTTEELPFDKYFAPFGLKVKPIKESEPIPYLGVRLQSENGKEVIKFVEADSPAAIAGIDPGDEILAIDGIRVDAVSISDRLKDYQPHDTIAVTLFHQDELITLNATLAQPQPNRYEIVQIENLSDTQQANLSGWLGQVKDK
jgi:predicted metalloprotease with PDZ domain